MQKPIYLGLVWVILLTLSATLVKAQRQKNQAEIQLGQLLFFDPVLSGNYRRSCASCHRPQKAFTDQRITARAYAFAANLPVNTPTLLGATRQRRFFHDGRARTLAGAIEAVLTNPAELNTTYEEVATRLGNSADYCRLFGQVYGRKPARHTINRALIAYLKELDWQPSQLPASPTPGYRLFVRAGCATCHAGRDFRDGKQYQVEPGRWVRTPTLRYLPQTPPYLSDGTAPVVEAVLTSSFHIRQRRGRGLEPTQVRSLVDFLMQLPADTTYLAGATPAQLPSIAGAPARRIGGSY